MTGLGSARVRRVGFGLLDQLVVALANAANPVLAVLLLDKTAAGVMLLAQSLAYFAMGLSRAFVGEVLLTQAPRLPADGRRILVRNGAAAAGSLGLLGAAVLLGVWALWPHLGIEAIDLSDLIWVVPALPGVLLQDAGRYAAFADHRQGRALVRDLTWVVVQGLAVAGLVLAGAVSGGALLLAWGAGAAAGAGVWLAGERVNPLRGRPGDWLRETRHLSGWFTATALLGQLNVQAVNFCVAGVLSPAAFVDFRLAQLAILQPVQNLVTASMGLLVPRASRLAGAGDAAGLRHQTTRVALALAGLAAVVVTVAVVVARPLLRLLLPDHVGVAALVLPLGVQAGIYLVQVAYTAALRGMQRAASLFVQYVVFAAAMITGVLVGAHAGGLVGAVWGLVGGASVGLVVMVAMYYTAVTRLSAHHALSRDLAG